MGKTVIIKQVKPVEKIINGLAEYMKKIFILTSIFVLLFSSRVLAVWSNSAIGDGNGMVMWHIAVGNGRNDGIMRVYGENGIGNMFEYTYSGSTWTKADMDSTVNY